MSQWMRNHKNKSFEFLKKPRVVIHFGNLIEKIDTSDARMFVDDVYLAVMPIGGGSSQEGDFSVEIRGSSEQKPQAMAILQSCCARDHSFSRPNLKELLSDAINEIARHLSWTGRLVYEIIRNKENEEAWRLYSFTDKRLFRAFGKCIQRIPRADRQLWKKSYAVIGKEDIWEIAMPKVLGGYRGYRSILKKLSNFKLGNFYKQQDLFVAKTTAPWGWNMRSWDLENWTEFYGTYRFITFNWAKACLREHIIKELNQLFRRLQIDAEIVIKGLPTALEILQTRQQMCDGKITFAEASKKCVVS